MKTVKGFVRETPNADPVPSVPVNIRYKTTNGLVPAGGVIGAGANPVTTGGDGSFTWTTELSPGPIYAEAVISAGSEVRIRHGDEVMQAGTAFVSDIPGYGKFLTNGVLKSYRGQLQPTASLVAREIMLNHGAAILAGHLWELDTTRNVVVPANATLAARWDLLVMRQYIGGTEIGRQDLVLVAGTVNATEPTINTDPNILEVSLCRVITANGASVSTIVDQRPYAAVRSVASASITPAELDRAYVESTALNELVDDRVDALLVAGSTNLTKTYNDGAGTLTLDAGMRIEALNVLLHSFAKTLDFGTGFLIADMGGGEVDIAVDPQFIKDTVRVTTVIDGGSISADSGVTTARTIGSISLGTLLNGVTYDVFAIGFFRAYGVGALATASVTIEVDGVPSSATAFQFDQGVDSSAIQMDGSSGLVGAGGNKTVAMKLTAVSGTLDITTGRLFAIAIPRGL
jgi:hypothetical protein